MVSSGLLPVTTSQPPQSSIRHALRSWTRLLAPSDPVVQFNLALEPEAFMQIFQKAITIGSRPYAAICVRTDVGANGGLLKYARRNLCSIMDHPLADRFVLTGPAGALPQLID
jgi:hypothetical protein